MDKETFQSDNISFTIEWKPNCIVEYQAKATANIVAEAKKKALHTIAKYISIPGFRKGKAPNQLVEKKHPKELEEEWKKQIADLSFVACQKTKFTPLLDKDTKISFQVKTFSLKDGAEMTFTFESDPIVPEVDPKKIEIEKVEVEVIDDKKVDEKINQIQHFFSDWDPISDRELQWGDYAIVDITSLEETPAKKILEDARFEVNKDKLAIWMSELLIGMKIGETKEGVSQPDPDASQETKEKNPPKKVAVTLHQIEVARLPTIDDEFAQRVGTKNLAEMRKNLAQLLKNQAEKAAKSHYRDQVNAHLIAHYSFDLPQSLIQQETRSRIQQVLADPTSARKLSAMNQEEKKNFVANLEMRGRNALLLFYLSRKIVQDQEISISPREIEDKNETILEALFQDPLDLYHPEKDSQEQKALAFSRLVLEKAEDYLIEHATIVPPKKKPPPKTEESEQEKDKSTEPS
ncbi:MAG: trigger factor [Chlamydiota bacterium]